MNPTARKFLDTLRCPLCNSLIDLLEWKQSIANSVKFNFCCSQNWEHYCLYFQYWKIPFFIEYERVCIFLPGIEYDILQSNSLQKTDVNFYQTDLENRIIAVAQQPVTYQYLLINFQESSQEEIVNRLMIIMTFS
jgi:histidinol phosphatase-like PHP family hydrolase